MQTPNTVICTYRIQASFEKQFLRALRKHWPTLNRLGLVRPQPRLIFEGRDESGKTFVVEIFAWKSAKAVAAAHRHPAVLAVWAPLEAMCENRLGRPAMEFPHVRALTWG